jgi:hypothetical protein
MMVRKDAKPVASQTPPVLTPARAEKSIITEWRTWAKKRGSYAITDMQIFYFVWLKKSRPELLTFKCRGDQWQAVRVWLQHDEGIQGEASEFPGVALEREVGCVEKDSSRVTSPQAPAPSPAHSPLTDC